MSASSLPPSQTLVSRKVSKTLISRSSLLGIGDLSSGIWNGNLLPCNARRNRRCRRIRVIRNASGDQSVQTAIPAVAVSSSSSLDSSSIASNIQFHAEFTPSFSPKDFGLPKAYQATSLSVRDSLIKNLNETYEHYEKINGKEACYLSMEFLQGRALLNAVGNLELTGAYAEALKQLGHDLESVAEQEPDAALGNGGLGRLASCFLDSLASLDYPAWGYGLRYKYGLFHQRMTKDGQEEVAESWLEMGNPWEIVRYDVTYPVKFYGKVVEGLDGRKRWVGGEDIDAVAYDVPIPGYKTKTTLGLRLWSTKVPAEDFDLQAFNAGDHSKAIEGQTNAEKICYVLYPGDESVEGKILRLKQQYTLCSASLQDIIARFERRSGDVVNWEEFPSKVAVQMNDTHPTLTVAYTNHTVLPEALEKWSLEIMQKLLPRHVEIIERIDEELIGKLVTEYGTEDIELLEKKISEMRILENSPFPASVAPLFIKPEVKEEKAEETAISADGEAKSTENKIMNEELTEGNGPEVQNLESSEIKATTDEPKQNEKEEKAKVPEIQLPKTVRMANLCVVAGHAVNGVAEIHSDIVKNEVFNDFYKLWPEKFQNKTNGVTPRRWMRFCNPGLSGIITKWLGTEDWILNTEKLAELRQFSENEELHAEWISAKRSNKLKLVSFIKEKTGYVVSPDAMFDIQVKRIHEYKRQLLNILGIVYRYKKMKEMSSEERNAEFVPRVCILGGKAFATYVQAKRIVKLVNDVGAVINHDPDIGDLLKVIFVPNYNVSVAELLIPASELSQHISTAGMEASGTSNMKFAMNGCVLIGTLDGANVEIREEVGEENFFLFGAQAHEIAGLRKERAEGKFEPDPRFEEAKEFILSGAFGKYDYSSLLGSLEGNVGYGRGDYFLVGKDFPSYIECQQEVDAAYRDQKRWTKMSIMNTAGSYKFSSDRTIHEYARDIWGIHPAHLS
ncbi:Alpha-1 glucan phosphorylase L isozyme [Nymphaea thermarum]|nr:Alpha-1 glucan phosphorylase L isozyme [Nymphaea thermarum]